MDSTQSTTSTPAATTQPQNITISTPAANPNHPSHWQTVLAAILAIFNATEPLVVTLVAPKVASGLQVGTAIEEAVAPIVIQATAPPTQ